MIYECDFCDAVLPAHVGSCPFCGEAFDNPVPGDAETGCPAPDAFGDKLSSAALELSPDGLTSGSSGAESTAATSAFPLSKAPANGDAWVSPYRQKAREIMDRHLTSLRLDEESVRLLEDAEGRS